MDKRGWLVNDTLTCIPGTTTLWHELLEWFPKLEDKTNGYTDYSILPNVIESLPNKPDYIIRNGSYFRKLNVDVPTISLIQDVQNNPTQTEVINSSTVVIFSSNHLYTEYKDRINPQNVRIIKWASDFNFFRPIPERHPDVLPNSIIFVGDSSYEKKGFHRVLDIIDKMPDFNFCLIMKDNTTMDIIPEKDRSRVRIFNKVQRKDMPLLINSCVCGICTSGYEEGHWAGVEMGACDLPMVTRPIGCYLDRTNDMSWGEFANDDEFPEKIRYVVSNKNLYSPRKYYSKDYTLDKFRENWIKVVEEFT
jgi:glycosyltransferase involved in cell wall biosynthesis